MKPRISSRTRSIGGYITFVALLGQTAVFAIEPPPDEATPPAALMLDEQPRRSPLHRKSDPWQPSESQAFPFVGVVTMEVPPLLADHLGLSQSIGVIVRTVLPGSPAELAGLQVNDIVTSINGNPIPDPRSFSSAIRENKVGDVVEIHRIHRGKPSILKLKLAKTPSDIAMQSDSALDLPDMSRMHPDRLRSLMGRKLDSFGFGDSKEFPDAQLEENFRQMRNRMNRSLEQLAIPEDVSGFKRSSTISLTDDEGSVEITTLDGDTQVMVRDRGKNIIWSGPWNTEDDKAAAPNEIRVRIDRINSGNATGFSFKFKNSTGTPETLGN